MLPDSRSFWLLLALAHANAHDAHEEWPMRIPDVDPSARDHRVERLIQRMPSRARASLARAIAEHMNSADARRAMLIVAENYERIGSGDPRRAPHDR